MNIEVPELEDGYPDPRFFGEIPAYGFFIRHVNGIELNNVEIRFMENDYRPAFILDHVNDAVFNHVKTQKNENIPTFLLHDVNDFNTHSCESVPDVALEQIEKDKL